MSIITDYSKIIQEFTTGIISAADFKSKYSTYYLDDNRPFEDSLFNLLDGLFARTDDYVEDPALYDAGTNDLTADELRQYAQLTLEKLSSLQS